LLARTQHPWRQPGLPAPRLPESQAQSSAFPLSLPRAKLPASHLELLPLIVNLPAVSPAFLQEPAQASERPLLSWPRMIYAT